MNRDSKKDWQISRTIHLARLFLLSVSAGGLLFWMGWIMGQDHYKQKVAEALKAGSSHDAGMMLYQRQQNGADVQNDPMFFISLASIHLKNKNAKAAIYNVSKAVEILGR